MADVGVVERGRGLGFAPEAGLDVGVAEQMSSEKLQGDRPFEIDVLGFVDDTHPALAEFFEDLVTGDGFADHGPTGEAWTIVLHRL